MDAAVRPAVSRGRRLAFIGLAALFGLAWAFGFGGFFALVGGWMASGEEAIHRVHDISWGIFAGLIMAVGFLAQVRLPERKVAALQQVAAGGVAMATGMLLSSAVDPFVLILLAMVLVAAVLHPARSALLTAGAVSRPLAGLAVLAGIPLVVYALGEFALQRGALPGDEHAELMHWVGMGVMALAIPLVGLVASLKTSGWRIPAWSAGLGLAVYGLASVVFPQGASSAGRAWGSLALVGGVLFIALAEWESRRGEG
ncbi:MAG: hypothetical protein M3N51_09075 [Actinomycetota bacterium]|nr:hypothetical protein [Actinomycetota bacterium]